MAKFQKGRSGNPAGRPPGIQTQKKLRDSIAKDLPVIIESLVSEAKSGDTAAAKVLLDRVLPALKPVEAAVALSLTGSLTEAGKAVLEALGESQLSPGDATRVMTALSTQARLVETDELVKRIEALEKQATR